MYFYLQVDYPVINETLQIEDSDDEDEKDRDNIDSIEEENHEIIQNDFFDALTKCLLRTDYENRWKMESSYLREVALQSECKFSVYLRNFEH